MVVWAVTIDGEEIEPNLFDVEVTNTANPFGSYAIIKVDDTDGSRFDAYPRGTRVDIAVSNGDGQIQENDNVFPLVFDTTFAFASGVRNPITVFSGYVVERREGDNVGADVLEVEAYTFDQFLRFNRVSDSTEGLTLSEALSQIITDDTPVTYVASNVEIQDNQTLTQELRGEKVENAIQAIRSKSANEDFGVNSDIEFFFRPRESNSTSRDIDNTQWLNYDLPERGSRAKNQVTVFYDGGEESVTVADGADKQELQDSLGTDDPVSLGNQISRPGITDIDDARDVADRELEGKSTTLTGTVTTFGLFDAEPGDVIDITITPRGIDSEFRIAEITYQWATDTTQLTIVEKRGDTDQTIVDLSETLDRVELQDVNRDGVNNRVTSTSVGVIITPTGSADTVDFESAVVTNVARNRLRNAWADEGNLDITEIAVGTGTDTPKRSQTALVNETERQTASETLPDATSVA